MKKLFFAICFSLFLYPQLSRGRVTPISGFENIPPQQNTPAKEPEVKEVEFNDFKEFLEERFRQAPKADRSTINQTFGYLPSPFAQQMQEESKKGFFQKIYEQALERASLPKTPERKDVAPAFLADNNNVSKQYDDWQDADFPLITAHLPPDGSPATIPALEHIPYLMNSIEVLPSGLVKFEETIVVVADGQKLRQGLTKILPLYIYDANGSRQKLDYSIISVRVNDMPIAYRFTSNDVNALLVPEDDYPLSPAIYTYKFEYVVDNLLWDYGDHYQLYWDVGGNGWNLVVDRLGASLNLPQPQALLGDEVFLGSAGYLSVDAISAQPNGLTAKAYIAKRPLFIGEGMHLVARIDKNALAPVSLWQKVIRSFYTHGDIYLSVLGLLFISGSFLLSWRYIAQDKGQLKIALPKTAMILRFLMFDRFDAKSACGFLLELYKKNIIDIQQSGETILLIKRTDNLKSLTLFEQKALKQLFPAHETVFNVSKQNILPVKRFAAHLESGLKKQMLKFRFKLNLGYLTLGLAMLVLTEAAIAFFKLNSAYVFGVELVASLAGLAAFALWFSGRRWLKILARFLALDIIIMAFIILAAVVHPLAALILTLVPAVIVWALNIYGRRLGLIKQYIRDVASFREYLEKHHDTIVLGKDFLTYQAAIWALDLEKDFTPTGHPEYNKLPIATNIAACWK